MWISVVARNSFVAIVFRSAAVAFFISSPPQNVFAAQIKTFPIASSGITIVEVRGELFTGDGDIFANVVKGIPRAIVFLNSPGGELRAGLSIGAQIRLLGFSTMVAEGKVCASACALAWLGGERRYLSSASQIGFHAAYVAGDGYKRESGLANAIVGAYLTNLGLDLNAVEYITSAAPDDIQWLDINSARRVGIDVLPLEELRTPNVTGKSEGSIQEQKPSSPSASKGSENSTTTRAVKAALKTLKNGGENGVRKALVACYARARELQSTKSVEYCFVFDVIGEYLTREQKGPGEFSSTDSVVDRGMMALARLGVPEGEAKIRLHYWLEHATNVLQSMPKDASK